MSHAVSTDAQLIEASVAGQIEAFTALVDRYQSLVCAVSYSATGDRALSEDVAQETFVAVWKGLSELREPSKLRGWLCGIARNLSSKARRHGGREIPSDAEVQAAINDMASAPSALDDALDRESEQLVWAALQNIPETYREPLVLFYRQDHSTKQVAEALGLSEEAVQQRLSRGRQQLKASVADLVERTLERTKPPKGFVAAVVAAISVSVIGTTEAAAATAVSSTSSSAGKPFPSVKGPFIMKTLKIAAVTTPVVLLVVAGTSLLGRASGPAPNTPRASSSAQVQPASPGSTSAEPKPRSDSANHAGPSELAARGQVPRPEQAGIVFSIVFSDADQKHSKELQDAIMPKVHETLDILTGCYSAFLGRQPSVRGKAGQVTVDVDLVKDKALGTIAVDTHYRAHLGTETDAAFDECMRESSFAIDYDAGQRGPQQGTVRIKMDFPDGSMSGEDQQAATRPCFEDLKRRRPDVALTGTIDDATFASCMDRAIGAPGPMNADPRPQACYDAARRRLPSATGEEISKDVGFSSCLHNMIDKP